MRIISVQLRNYRVYRSLDLEMPGGVVGVYGANGSGKSSLLESIVWALFGKARTHKQQIPTVGETGECSATIEFEHEGHFYRVKRSISGQSFTVKARVWFGEEIAADGPSEVEKFIQSVLGMDAASFRASVFAEQKQLAAFSDQAPDKRRQMVLQLLGITPLEKARDRARSEARDLKAHLDRSAPLLTSVADAESAVVSAEAALVEARAEVEQSNRALELARSAATHAESAVRSLEDDQRRDTTIRERGGALRKELDQLQRDAESVSSDIAAAELIPAMLAELNDAAAALPALELHSQRVNDYLDRRQRLASIPQIEIPIGPTDHELAIAEAAVRETAERRSTVAGHVSALQDRVTQAEAVVRRSSGLDGADSCPTCGQELGANLEQIRRHHAKDLTEAKQLLYEATIDVKTLTAAAKQASVAFDELRTAAKKAAAAQVKAAAVRGQRDHATEELATARAQLVAVTTDRLAVTAQESADDDALERRLLTLRSSLADELHVARQAAGKAEGLRAQAESLDRLVARRADIERRTTNLAGERSTLLAELKTLAFDRAMFDQALATRKAAEHALAEAQRKATEAASIAGRQLGLAEARRASLAEASERHAALADQRLNAHLLMKTAGLLHDFRQHIVGLIGPQLQIQASALFNELTNHDYDGLEVDPESYELKIIDHGVAHPTSRFSGSEVDLANLALRVAISEQIRFQAGGQVGLLVLDEALASLDADRKDRTLNALGQLGGRFQQILVVTHSPEVKEQLPSAIEVRRSTASGVRASTATVLEAGA